MVCLCGMEYMFLGGYWTQKWACHGSTQQLRFFMNPDRGTLPPVARLSHSVFVRLMGATGGAEAWARCMSSLTQVVCTPAIQLIP
jgi:hypothetical protein